MRPTLTLFLSLALLGACGDDGGGPVTPPPPNAAVQPTTSPPPAPPAPRPGDRDALRRARLRPRGRRPPGWQRPGSGGRS